MKVSPIRNSLPGETILAVQPQPAPQQVGDWRRRLNYYTGRALSGVALVVEQQGRGGHLATLGQAVSSGVLTGLEVHVTRGALPQLVIAPGRGLTPNGEDVLVPESLTIDWRQLEVFFTEDAPPSLLEAVQLQRLATRRLEENGQPVLLSDWLSTQNEGAPNARPPVGVLVLQPIVYRRTGNFDPDDQCERDVSSEAFDDRQWIDGCRVAFHAWHDSWIVPYDPAKWRNQLAYRLFEAELQRQPEQLMPWELQAVPLALVGFTADNTLEFVDRRAVVRAAGKAKPRGMLVDSRGAPRLWQARVHQFAEQVADQLNGGLAMDNISDSLDFLPPVGVIPRATAQLNQLSGGQLRRIIPRQSFFSRFSPQLSIRMAPIPAEELDVAMRASYSQRPYERGQPDEMQLLVPVPQRFYDPRLLVVEEVDPIFQATIDKHVKRRAEWLQRRTRTRHTASEILRAISGKGIVYPDPDPGALEPEAPGADPLAPPEPTLRMSIDMDSFQVVPPTASTAQGNVITSYNAANGTLDLNIQVLGMPANEIQEIHLRAAAPGENGELVGLLPASFQADERGVLRQQLAVNVEAGQRDQLTAGDFYLTLTTDKHPDGAIRGQLTLNPIDELKAELINDSAVGGEASQVDALGVDQFIASLENKIKQADDVVDVGFAGINAALYKVRQLMLGTADASRLATSPALAAIAVKGDSASTTRDDIRAFVDNLKFKEPSVVSERAVSARTGISAGGTVGFGEVAFDPTRFTVTTFEPSAEVVASPFPPVAPVVRPEKSVFDQMYLVGKPELTRTVTIGERLRLSEASEIKNAAVSSFYGAVTNVINLEMNVDDLTVSGIAKKGENNNAVIDDRRRVVRVSTTVGVLKKDPAELARILQDPDPPNPDESDFYSGAIDVLEHAIALLRRLEGRVQQYRAAIATCQRTLGELQKLAIQADRRLKEIADELAEARHDVSVARALRDEAQATIDAINRHRDQIVAQHVKYLAYHRTRLIIPNDAAPSRDLDPGLLEEPLPACLGAAVDVPRELRAMVDLFRDAPIKWFPKVAALLEKLDEPQTLQRSLVVANRRAQAIIATTQTVPFQIASTILSQSIGKAFTAQQNSVSRHRANSARANLVAISKLGWKATREKAKEIVSLGDLLDADHARSDVVQGAARELDDIAHVASCLYEAMGGVAAAIRLVWAENISQFDEPVDLSDLSRLPKWGDPRIEFPQRVKLQTLNRWLFGRVNQQESEAVGLISDLVRVCILLASHAPVKQILSGRVEQTTPLQPGANVSVRPLAPNVRIGMPVLMFKSNRVVARAVVDDLVQGRATTRVVQVFESRVVMDKDDLVQFGSQAGTSAPQTRGSGLLR